MQTQRPSIVEQGRRESERDVIRTKDRTDGHKKIGLCNVSGFEGAGREILQAVKGKETGPP